MMIHTLKSSSSLAIQKLTSVFVNARDDKGSNNDITWIDMVLCNPTTNHHYNRHIQYIYLVRESIIACITYYTNTCQACVTLLLIIFYSHNEPSPWMGKSSCWVVNIAARWLWTMSRRVTWFLDWASYFFIPHHIATKQSNVTTARAVVAHGTKYSADISLKSVIACAIQYTAQ